MVIFRLTVYNANAVKPLTVSDSKDPNSESSPWEARLPAVDGYHRRSQTRLVLIVVVSQPTSDFKLHKVLLDH